MRPLSEVLLELAQPFFDSMPNDQQLHDVMVQVVTIWNLALLSEKKQALYWEQISKQLKKGLPPEVAPVYFQELRACFEWRKSEYGDDRRFISYFEVVRVAGEPRLRVYSSLTSEPKKPD